MSKTPRTDDREFAAIDVKPSSRVVYASFARQLEAELAESRAEIEHKNKIIEQMWEALKLADDLIDEYAADYEHRDNVDEIREEIKAALAAERGEK